MDIREAFLWYSWRWIDWSKGFSVVIVTGRESWNFFLVPKFENSKKITFSGCCRKPSSQLLVPPKSLEMARQPFPHSFLSWTITTKWEPHATNWLRASRGWNILLHKWPETSRINKTNSELHSFPEPWSSTSEHGFVFYFLPVFKISKKEQMSQWINIQNCQILRQVQILPS